MMTLPRRRAVRVLFALLSALLLASLSACGGGGWERGEGTPTMRLIIAESVNTALGNLPLDAGMAQRHGIAIEKVVAPSGGSSNQVSALIAGDVQLAVSGTNAAIDAISRGAELKIIAGVGPLANSLTMARPVAQRLGVTEATPVPDKIRALRGLRVASPTPGSAGNAVLVRLLRDAGLDPATDVQLVPIQDNAAITGGLAQGTFDASFAAIGAGEEAATNGSAVVLASVPRGDFPQLNDFVGVVLYTTAGFAEDNPDLVEAVRQTYLDGARLAVDDPDAAAAALQAGSLSGMNPATFTQAWAQVQPSAAAVGPFTEQNWNKFLELFGDNPEVNYRDLTYASLVAQPANQN
jgi:NitT/TauT family transport system substrate-binding protein